VKKLGMNTLFSTSCRVTHHYGMAIVLNKRESDTVGICSNRPLHVGTPSASIWDRPPPRQYMADFSLALINRTGAYFVCRDLLRYLPDYFAATRYWRVLRTHEPRKLVRWLLGKAMLMELAHGPASIARRWPQALTGCALPTLFLDPLYVLRSELKYEDIVLCHDVGPVSHPTLFDASTVRLYKSAYDRIVRARTGIVFVSEASRRTFVAHFGADFRFLRVIPLYVRRGIELANDVAPPAIRKPFLLSVGALEARKNYARILAAFQQSGLADCGYTYAFCGPRGNAAEEVEKLAKGAPAVQSLGYRSDAELRWLYRNASGLVLPSLLEGFGLPSLEAAQHRLLSMVSAGTAQEEAVGNGAILVDPLSIASIAAGMRELVEMPGDKREAKLALATQRARELTLEAYLMKWSDLLARP
jgi:glycosyltransferase involved in cell wall biosynthesis